MENYAMITGILLTLTGLLYYGLIGLFTMGWQWAKGALTPGSTTPGMKVSVIIAARNEEKNIALLLADLKDQDYPPELLQVIVVDDHSEDNTAEVVRDFIAKNSLAGFKMVKIEDDDRKGKKAAITHGIKSSAGSLILVTDADCRLQPGWISAMASNFQDDKIMMIFGLVSYFPRKGILNKFQSLEFSALVASGGGAAIAGHPFMCNGACLAYRKSAFLQVRGFEGNERFLSGDDVFLMHKIKKEFGKRAIGFIKDTRALVLTSPAPGLRAFFNQRIRWASKSKGYRDLFAAATALIVFAYNAGIAAIFLAGFLNSIFFMLFAGSVIIKAAIDFALMWGVTGFTGNRKLMKWYLPFQAVYPFYIVLAGILSLFGKRKW